MNVRCGRIPPPVEAVEHHSAIVPELWQLVTIENQSVFAVANNLHIGLQDLCREFLAENEIDVVVQSVPLAQLYEMKLLLESTEQNHTWGSILGLWLFDEHLGAKVHELCRSKLIVGIKEFLAGQVALALAIVSVYIP